VKAGRRRQRTWLDSDFYQAPLGGKAPPQDLRDLPELPLSDKAMLRVSQAEHPPFGNYLAAPRDTAARLHRTSGTTGQAMNLALSARDCEVTEIVGGRCQSAAGLGPGHVVVHCLNYQMWMGGLTDHMTLERTGALVVPFGVGNTELLVRTITGGRHHRDFVHAILSGGAGAGDRGKIPRPETTRPGLKLGPVRRRGGAG
jgi:phenylacetate-CoA ligase